FVSPGITISAQFSEAMTPTSFGSSQFELRQGSTFIPSTATYVPVDHSVAIKANQPLAMGTTYTVIAHSGAAGPKDLGGNGLASDVTWTFTTMPSPGCPCSVFTPSQAPLIPADGDPSSLAIGLRFHSDPHAFATVLRSSH